MDEEIYKSVLNVGSFKITITVIQDWGCDPLEYIEVQEFSYNPLPINSAWCDEESPFNYTEFAMDNYYKNAYFTIEEDTWFESKRYFMINQSIVELQSVYSKLGYAKHDAWLLALDCLKSQAKHIQNFFSGEWHFVGFTVDVTESFSDDSGLIWSREIEYEHNSLWGIEWSIYLETGDNSSINNEKQFKNIVPDLLPDKITLTDEQLHDLWLNLTSS